jgi:hypothetical protein
MWSKVPDGGFIPRQTGRLTVGRKITHSLTQLGNDERIGTGGSEVVGELLWKNESQKNGNPTAFREVQQREEPVVE